MEYKKTTLPQDTYLRAEKQVFAGIYGRLFARYIAKHAEGYASILALAVTRALFSHPSKDESSQLFIEQNDNQIAREIMALKDDTLIRRILTDTMVIKTVFQHKQGGCRTDDVYGHIEKLKKLGIYLEGSHPPTPNSFVRMASRFFTETPLRPSIPPLST